MQVVIIDDNNVNLRLMESLVQRAGECTPVIFQDSGAGLEWCLTHVPDLLIVDYMMPPPDGLEFIRRFRAHPLNADIPVLMITAD
jgi:putative two-component system response regulator